MNGKRIIIIFSDYTGFGTTELLFHSNGDYLRDDQKGRKCSVRNGDGKYDLLSLS